MRSFSFQTLTSEEFDAFSATNPCGNFQQTSFMGDLRTKEGIPVEYLGVIENGNVVAAAQLELHKTRLSTYTVIHDGPLCDLHDAELCKFFFAELKKHSSKLGAAQIEITPETPYAIRASNGELLTEGDPMPTGVPAASPAGKDDAAYQTLLELGCMHEGFYKGYSSVPRWRYVKDLSNITDEKALLSTYAKNTKRNERIARTSGVSVERIKREDLALFRKICEMSGEKQGFKNPSLEYFQMMYDALGDACEFNIAYIDAKAYLQEWEEKRDAFAADVKRLSDSLETAHSPEKVQKKLADVQKKYEASLKRIETAHASSSI